MIDYKDYNKDTSALTACGWLFRGATLTLLLVMVTLDADKLLGAFGL